ncbi:hypothetical protein V1514DRAFT_348468 [Lipomyces japonicus]|uniref:uncharacterized protein n=1 Tax=Lipomyces japonicus TaxID=56871 RepID=UPI0034CDEE22
MIGLVGGATVELGDPSGRTSERTKMDDQVRTSNEDRISKQMEKIFTNGIAYAKSKGFTNFGNLIMTNNAIWWKDMTLLSFMTTIGRHLRVSQMMAKESVKLRLESENGIGYNEFTYQALQAYDFYHLHATYSCNVQFGGNDQWGNITAGIDLTSRLQFANKKPQTSTFGITAPLLTTPSGEKFGKSAGNAVWLDPELTSPFELYQYFVRLPDDQIGNYLRAFTLLTLPEISSIVDQHALNPEKRIGQHALAKEVTDLVHGLGAGDRSQRATALLFAKPDRNDNDKKNWQFSAAEIINAFQNDQHLKFLPSDQVLGQSVVSVLRAVANFPSNKSAMNRINAGGIYVGKDLDRLTDPRALVEPELLIDDKVLLLRVGKADLHVVALE